MKLERSAHAFGGATLVLTGLMHSAAHLYSHSTPHPPAQQALLDQMNAVPILPGNPRTFRAIFEGYSLTFALFALFAGVLALVLLRRAGDRPELMRPLRSTFVVFLAVETAISALWFIPPPTILLGLATLGFLVSRLSMDRGAQ